MKDPTVLRAPVVCALTAALTCLTLAGCKAPIEAPADKGVCWHMSPKKEGGYNFNKVSENLPSLEYCAAALEKMRQDFVRLGGSHTQITGAYQGQFIFVQREGIFTSSSLDTTPYLALVRSGDGAAGGAGRHAPAGAVKLHSKPPAPR